MSRKLMAPTVLCTHGTLTTVLTVMTAHWTEVTLTCHQVKLEATECERVSILDNPYSNDTSNYTAP